jgi:hypothetical protein
LAGSSTKGRFVSSGGVSLKAAAPAGHRLETGEPPALPVHFAGVTPARLQELYGSSDQRVLQAAISIWARVHGHWWPSS